MDTTPASRARNASQRSTDPLVQGRYEILRRIGRGGSSSVHEAFDTHLERKVALKRLHPTLLDEPTTLRRFHSEARAAAKVAGPHVVGVYDHGEDSDGPYLVMELIDGPTLKNALRTGVLPYREGLRIVDDTLSGLESIHQQGIVHRDVKPDNILLSPSGAKLADFGIALHGTEHLTETGDVLGTAPYLAPEVLQGQRATVQSDLYAVGVTLHEVLTGQRPYQEKTSALHAVAVIQGRRTPLRELRPDLPPALSHYTDMLLGPSGERPRSASEARTLLKDALDKPWTRPSLRVPTRTKPDVPSCHHHHHPWWRRRS